MEKKILEKLKKLRISHGYTTKEISRKINIEESSFKKVENGKNKSWHKYFFDLLEIYQISASAFFSDLSSSENIAQDINVPPTHDLKAKNAFIYADKTIVKNLLSQKDKTIELLEKRLHELENQQH